MAVVSTRFGFVFVKTTKTAGTSIEVELSKLVEPGAVVTPVVPAEPGHRPRNFRRGPFRKPFYNHMPASLIRRFLGDQRFFGMYRFCVERDPVTKCISHFHMLRNSDLHGLDGAPMSWADYVEAGDFPIDTDKYVDWVDGRRQRIVDEIIPYEDMAASLARIGQQLDIGQLVVSAKAKAGYSRERAISPEQVTASQRKRIMVAFAESLSYSGLADFYEARHAALMS
jgi:hypothetical protein